MKPTHTLPATSPMTPAVNHTLTPNTRTPRVENSDYAAFARRVLRAYGRRVAAGDIEALTHLAALSSDVDAAIRDAISGLRAFGYSWADIATRLGVTKQAAQQRWSTTPR